MTDISFNLDYDTMRNEQSRYAMKAIEESNIRLSVLVQEENLSLTRLDRRLFRSSVAASRQFARFLRHLLKQRLQAGKTANDAAARDIFSFLEQCRDPDTGAALSMAEISTETATFVVAGADTTSTAFSALSHYLASSSEWYHKVTDEIRGTFSSREHIKLGPRLNSCVNLRACLDESLRLSPPGGSALWREVEAGGAVIDGQFIAQGCDVGVGMYSIHHNARYWTDPHTFEPQRWLQDGKQARRAYVPFSSGPRSCVGKPLAIAQVMLTFARLLFEFDMRRADSIPTWARPGDAETIPAEYSLKDHVSGKGKGPWLQYRSRGV